MTQRGPLKIQHVNDQIQHVILEVITCMDTSTQGHNEQYRYSITCPTTSPTARRFNELGSRAVYLLAQSTDLGMGSWASRGK
jgi:hypothetical protein